MELQKFTDELNKILREFESHTSITVTESKLEVFKHVAFPTSISSAMTAAGMMCAELVYYILNYCPSSNLIRQLVESNLNLSDRGNRIELARHFCRQKESLKLKKLTQGWSEWEKHTQAGFQDFLNDFQNWKNR